MKILPGVSLVTQVVKKLLQYGRPGLDPWVGKMPWRRVWQPIPVFLPGESPWTEEPGGLQSMGSQESDMTEQLNTAHENICPHISILSVYSFFFDLLYSFSHIVA